MATVEVFVYWSLGIAVSLLFWFMCVVVGFLIVQWARGKIKEIKENTGEGR